MTPVSDTTSQWGACRDPSRPLFRAGRNDRAAQKALDAAVTRMTLISPALGQIHGVAGRQVSAKAPSRWSCRSSRPIPTASMPCCWRAERVVMDVMRLRADAASVLRPRATDSVPDSFIELGRCRVQPRLFPPTRR